jgi:N-acyl-phosphatidylethanolamine-hydrolysing phospholipase D
MTESPITVSKLSTATSHSPDEPPSHHVGSPPTSFRNPWPSAEGHHGPFAALKLKFSSPGMLPLPPADELVKVREPDWGAGKNGLKATWFGHASFLVETTARNNSERGVRILFDPVFSERMSPVPFIGPKRFVALPCTLEDVPEVDLVVISHNHYDHLDVSTVNSLYARRGKGNIHFLCGLGLQKWFIACGIEETDVTELDWWDGRSVSIDTVGSVNLTCTPSQHGSARTARDGQTTLWCSWVLEETALETDQSMGGPLKKLFFAGDTAYKYVSGNEKEDEARPPCPAFAEIGSKFGEIDLALVPIGCFLPRDFMSTVHASPEDSMCIHKDVRSKKSIGMHYGTIRAGISGQVSHLTLPLQSLTFIVRGRSRAAAKMARLL